MEELLLNRYKIKVHGVDFDLKFLDNITLIKGNSGLGKTMLFKAMENDSLVSKNNMLCLNYDDIQSGNVDYVLDTAKGKVIVIDNADIVLTLEQRYRISLDRNNQYIVFAHSTEGYKPNKRSITRLVLENNQGHLNHFLVRN